MKKVILFSVVLILLTSAAVTSQPFTATIVLYPGCGSQFSYGQKVCGELSLSDDAWVTRWVEDVNGTIWYHWGTRYYTAGAHTLCGYMGLPIGVHIMKIHAVRVSDGALADSQCEYTVCCGYSVFIPHRPTCSCEKVVFTASVDKTQATPGDYITVIVTVTNNMAQDCTKKIDAGHLQIDWGILGGNTSPLEKDVGVSPGETRTILEEKHLIPPVPEGVYNVVISYSDSECTWVDYTTISVKLETAGSLEIVSYPEVVNVSEDAGIKLLVRNQSQKQANFTLSVKAPSEIHVPVTEYTVNLPQAGYQEVNVRFTPEEVGTYVITLDLMSGSASMGTASISVKVEKPLSGQMEIVYEPETVLVDESALVIVKVVNPTQYDAVYQIQAAGLDVQIPTIPELFVPGQQSREAEIFIIPLKEGVHEVVFRLEAEGQLMDSKQISFTAEKETRLSFVIPVIIGGLAVVAAAYLILRKRHP